MTRIKLHVKRGDMVEVLTGDDRGRKGKVLEVYPAKSRALVEGINLHKKALRPTQDNPEGGISEREMPVHISNLKTVESEKAAEAAE